MCSRVVLRPLGITASIFGIIQGLLWTAIFIFGILVYTGQFVYDYPVVKSHSSLIFYAILDTYFVDPLNKVNNITYNGTVELNLIVTPDLLFIWQIVYLVLSFLWAVSSMFLLYVMIHEKEQKYKLAVTCWAVEGSLVAICDLSISVLMAIDYFDIYNVISDDMSILGNWIFYESVLWLLTFFDRGIVLWIVNVVLIILLLASFFGTDAKSTDAMPYPPQQPYSNQLPDPMPQNLNNYQQQNAVPNVNHNPNMEKVDKGVYNPIYAWLDPNAADKLNIPRVPLQQRTFVKRIFNFHNKIERSNSRSTTHGSAEDLFNNPDLRSHYASSEVTSAHRNPRPGGAPPPPPPPMPPPSTSATPSVANISMFSYPETTVSSSGIAPLKSALKKNQPRSNNGPIMR